MSDQLPIGYSAISQTAPSVSASNIITGAGLSKSPPIVTTKLKTLAQLECEHIEKALKIFENNKSKTAQALGITTKTLYNKLHYYGLFDLYMVPKKGDAK